MTTSFASRQGTYLSRTTQHRRTRANFHILRGIRTSKSRVKDWASEGKGTLNSHFCTQLQPEIQRLIFVIRNEEYEKARMVFAKHTVLSMRCYLSMRFRMHADVCVRLNPMQTARPLSSSSWYYLNYKFKIRCHHSSHHLLVKINWSADLYIRIRKPTVITRTE